MWSDTLKWILIFFKWFKGWKWYAYRTWSSSLVNVLPLEVVEPKHKGEKSLFKLYRVFSLPRFYLGELSCRNFGAINRDGT